MIYFGRLPVQMVWNLFHLTYIITLYSLWFY